MSERNPETRSDQALIEAANRGDAGAFETLYDRYKDWVFALALRFTRNHAHAADVTQETFLYFLRKFPGFVLTAQLKTFLYPAVRHNALAIQRAARKAMTTEHVDTEAPTAAQHDAPLREAMQALDPGHREVVILRFADELSLQEIALAMELPVGTVKSRLHHALAQLRRNPLLAKYFESP